MKILFVVTHVFLSEPLGAMILMAICNKEGHETKLVDATRGDLSIHVKEWDPDVIAYSTVSSDLHFIKRQDKRAREVISHGNKKVFRIMGGPCPTYSPEVIDELELDAICQGDGDRALPALLSRLEKGQSLVGIPNIALTSAGAETKELVEDLDSLPFVYREGFYDVAPYYKECGLRSFLTQRGCPYNCTYCFNHAFNKMFKGCGTLIRKRSVENLISEIEYVIKKYPPVKMIRFGDDTFAHKADDWLKEFSEKYASRIKLPFYCLMRSNTLTEETAYLLSRAGCQSMAMSIESGVQRVRQDILKRNISDELCIESFEIAKKYGINVIGATMIGIPGSTLEDDFKSLEFTRKIRPAAPNFPILTPYPGTEIWKYAVDLNLMDKDADVYVSAHDLSVLKCYSKKEKETQLRISYLGALYCHAPRFLAPLICKLIKSNVSLKICRLIGEPYQHFCWSTKIFPQVFPRKLTHLLHVIKDTFKAWSPVKDFDSTGKSDS